MMYFLSLIKVIVADLKNRLGAGKKNQKKNHANNNQ